MASDTDPTIKSAVIDRYSQLCAEQSRTVEAIGRLQAHRQSLAEQIDDCFVAARLFGFELNQESDDCGRDSHNAVRRRRPTIRSLVLEAARESFPDPVRAPELRQQLAARGFPTHEATVRMYLYRSLQTGRIRREGTNWFFVPPTNGHAEPERDAASVGETAGGRPLQSVMAA